MSVRVLQAGTPEAIASAAAAGASVLAAGGLVAFPTETVYGLGAHALDSDAITRLYAAKGRPAHNPVIVHVADVDAARALARAWPEAATRLAAAHWPGPLTLVVRKRSDIPAAVTAGLDRVAIRIPDHPVALALLRAAAIPIAAPSANRSGGVSPTTAEHVVHAIGDRIDLVLDGGPTTVGIESTVVDVTTDPPTLLRPGMLTREILTATLGIAPVLPASVGERDARPSPGMLARHYAPDAEVRMVAGGAGALERAVADLAGTGASVAVLTWSGPPPEGATAGLRLPDDPAGYARGLYAALHALDREIDLLLIEVPPADPAWEAIRDRVRRASAPREGE